MELSKRLNSIVKHMDKCEKMADIGSDHGYIPIYAVKNNICRRAIASDINKGPVEKARMNAMFEGVSDFVDVRLGAGLKTIRKGEVNSIVIAGMGRNLIRDILEADLDKVKELEIENVEEQLKKDISKETKELASYKHITKIEIRKTEFIKTTTKKIKR